MKVMGDLFELVNFEGFANKTKNKENYFLFPVG